MHHRVLHTAKKHHHIQDSHKNFFFFTTQERDIQRRGQRWESNPLSFPLQSVRIGRANHSATEALCTNLLFIIL